MNSRQETEAIIMKEHWVLACSLAQALIQPRNTCLGMVPPTVGWTLLHQLTMKKIPHRHVHKLIWSWWFFSWLWVLWSWQLKTTGTFIKLLGLPLWMNSTFICKDICRRGKAPFSPTQSVVAWKEKCGKQFVFKFIYSLIYYHHWRGLRHMLWHIMKVRG